jgi:hypothetical protein
MMGAEKKGNHSIGQQPNSVNIQIKSAEIIAVSAYEIRVLFFTSPLA